MSQYLSPVVILIVMINLIFFRFAEASSRGPDSSTVSLDEIKSSVASSLDLGNSNVEQTR